MRALVLDSETTGLDPNEGHRIIEIGCVELNDRRPTGNDLHRYIQPNRQVDPESVQIHGITDDFLADKPTFEQISDELRDYLADAELIIHNAPFDLAFLDAEFSRIDPSHTPLAQTNPITDTLADARERFPGQRNSLDALCKRFEVDNADRDLHGALLDARLLADVYRAMTGGQVQIGLTNQDPALDSDRTEDFGDLAAILARADRRPRVVGPTPAENAAHETMVDYLEQQTGETSAWRDHTVNVDPSMGISSQGTIVNDIQFGPGNNFTVDQPFSAEVDVTAQDEDNNIETFKVELIDGRFRPERNCHITTHESNSTTIDESEYPAFDLDAIVDAAEQYMEQNTEVHDIGCFDEDNKPIRLIETPNQVHLAPENEQAHMMEAIVSFDDVVEAKQYAEMHLAAQLEGAQVPNLTNDDDLGL